NWGNIPQIQLCVKIYPKRIIPEKNHILCQNKIRLKFSLRDAIATSIMIELRLRISSQEKSHLLLISLVLVKFTSWQVIWSLLLLLSTVTEYLAEGKMHYEAIVRSG
ncbi:MAG: hypothetical protein PVI19_14135, partial [Syntrophobacterales bacterium]